MSTLPNATYAAPGAPLYGKAGSGGSSNLTTSTLVLTAGTISSIIEAYPGATRWTAENNGSVYSELRMDGTFGEVVLDVGAAETVFSQSNILTNVPISGPQLLVSTVSAGTVDANLIDTNFISATTIDIDGQTLTANPTELLLNGIPLATTSNISSLADWSLEPAISSVQMSGFDLLSTGTGTFSSVIAQTGVFQDISTVTFTALSTIHAVSTISSLFLEAQQVNVSTLFASAFLSTPDIEVSSINGATFGSSSITVEVMGVSSLVANSISSLGAVLQTALVSTLQFNPSFSPSLDVNLGLGSLFGNLAGAAAGGLGVLVGAAGLGTGIAALAQGRQTNNINSNTYELVNGTTQLQVSTLGTSFSTVYRFVSSSAENVPGEEIFVSTIYPAGPAIRSLSDPLNTVSSPTSTIQSFGQWVSLGDLQPPSTVSTFAQLDVGTLNVSTINMPATGQISGTDNISSGTTLTGFYEVDASKVFTDILGSLYNPEIEILQPVKLSPSTLLYSATTDAELVVATPSDPNDYGQLACSALRLTSSATASNGVVFYNSVADRLNFLDDALVNHTLAYTVDSVLAASTLNVSTATVQGQIIIEPSTTRSGVYMPFDATNGTGVVAIGLSTGSIYNQYAALLGLGLGGSSSTVMSVLETKDNEVSFQYGDFQAGRLFLNGYNNYGVQPSAVLEGDLLGNLLVQAPNTSISSLTVSSINNAAYLPFRGGQYYRSSNQNLPTGQNFIIFDSAKPWNSLDFVQTDPSTFVCSTTGTYQIGLNATIFAGTGAWTALNKGLLIQQDRGGAENVIVNTTSIPNGSNYGQSVSALIDINQGDNLRFITGQTLTSGSTICLGLSNVFDYNTFWDYQLLRTG